MGNCLKAASDTHSLLRDDTSMENVQSADPPPPYQEETAAPIFNVSHPIHSQYGQGTSSLSEEQQVRLAQRLGLIQHLPAGTFDGTKKKKECVICMNEFAIGDSLRFLPCMHTYHKDCIDDWLLRSFTCPSCMEPVDAALISTFYSSD